MSCDLRGNGTLIIVVLKARNLPNRRKLDKQNPYCIARIANIVDRTPAIARGGQTPEWNHELRFQLTLDINPLLKLSVLDETKKSPVLIGDAEIDCLPVFNTTADEGYDKWHPLQYAGRTAGEIYVEMTFYPTAPIEPVRKKGAVTLHRNTVRPLPTRPGEEDSFADLSDDLDCESFRSVPRSLYEPLLIVSRLYGLSHRYSPQSSYGSEHPLPMGAELLLQDSIARQILRENPEQFEALLAQNPELAQSVARSRSISPQRNLRSINALFDDLEKEVQTDWYRNNLGTLRYSQFRPSRSPQRSPQRVPPHASPLCSPQRSPYGSSANPGFDPLKMSTILPKLPEFDTSRMSGLFSTGTNSLTSSTGSSGSAGSAVSSGSAISTGSSVFSSGSHVPRKTTYLDNVPPPPPHKSINSSYSTGTYGTGTSSHSYYSKQSFLPFPRKKPPPREYYTESVFEEL